MARKASAYVVRAESAGTTPGSVDQLYPYTLKGLTDALEEARFRSFAGPPQVVYVVAESGLKAIRRYEDGRERALRPDAYRLTGGAGRTVSWWPGIPTSMMHRAGRGEPGVIEEIVPASAAWAESFDPSAGTGLFPEEEALVARATEKRRREFATGRECAREALSALGLGKVPILRGYRGAPQWPQGVTGSITHCSGYCAAAVARVQHLASIGLDAEPNDPLPGGVLELVSQPAERTRLRDLSATAPEVSWDRLLFCAKEALYKAWFPLTGRWLGFADADITINAADATFTARLLVPAPGGPPLGDGFTGKWLARDGFILAAIAVPA
jgi:4'-phosphopantetheinyl transferase EntD